MAAVHDGPVFPTVYVDHCGCPFIFTDPGVPVFFVYMNAIICFCHGDSFRQGILFAYIGTFMPAV